MAGDSRLIEDLGERVAHLALQEGVPVYDPDGNRVGVVERVQTDADGRIFEGLIIHTHPLPGRHVYADHGQIAQLRRRGVVLAVGRDALHRLDDRPARRRDDVAVENGLEASLRKAWDWLTGAR